MIGFSRERSGIGRKPKYISGQIAPDIGAPLAAELSARERSPSLGGGGPSDPCEQNPDGTFSDVCFDGDGDDGWEPGSGFAGGGIIIGGGSGGGDDGDDAPPPAESQEPEEPVLADVGGGCDGDDIDGEDIDNMAPQEILNTVQAEGWPVNPEERTLCLNNPLECASWGKAVVYATAVSEAELSNSNFPVDSSPPNALKHAYWNTLMTVEMGTVRAEVWADAHETGLGNAEEGDPDVDPSTEMDYYNNQEGREIGSIYYPATIELYGPPILAIIKALRDGGGLRNWACGPWPGSGTHHPGGDGECGTDDDFWPENP